MPNRTALASPASPSATISAAADSSHNTFAGLARPLAIAMWDFSWLERRWAGAGYEDWDRALDELAERGYDAVRIDAYPHLVAAGAERAWEIVPPWTHHDWGSPKPMIVRVMPALIDFISKCAERRIQVGLSTWFQNDSSQERLRVTSAQIHAAVWVETLGHVERAGLLDSVCYVDFCNEWPLRDWAPFFTPHTQQQEDWRTPESISWMKEAVVALKRSYPQLPLTFSLTTRLRSEEVQGVDVGFLDFLEPHQWMSTSTDFAERLKKAHGPLGAECYRDVVPHAEALYRRDPQGWQENFAPSVDGLAAWGKESGKPLATTEGWAIVEYKDGPGLDWGWVKEMNAWAVERAAASGRWAAICTSNFCGPQFRGMWDDVQWHQEQTRKIHTAPMAWKRQ